MIKSIKKILLVLLLIPFLSSCGDEKAPKKLYISKVEGLTDREKQLVEDTVEKMNASAGYEIITFSSGQGNKPVQIRSIDREGFSNPSTVLAHARYLEYHCLVELGDDLEEMVGRNFYPGKFFPTKQTLTNEESDKVWEGMIHAVMHEFGHCYGFTHADDSQTLPISFLQCWFQGQNVHCRMLLLKIDGILRCKRFSAG